MNEFLSNLLIAVITAAVPVLTTYGVKLIKQIAANAATKTDSAKQQGYIKEIADAIADAVSATSQTYVDALKASGNFTKENQEEALKKAVEQAERLLTAEARSFLEKAYGDLNAYLVSKIEAEVRVQKQQGNTITLGEPFTAEVKEAPDVTTVAAATAAATAAAVIQNAIPQASPASAPDRPQEGAEAPAV